MKKKLLLVLALGVLAGSCFGLLGASDIYADESEETTDTAEAAATSIGITPVSKVLQIASNSSYEDSFIISNNSPNEMKIELYAAPYSYVYSEESGEYQLGFNNENNYTQISRWVTFQAADGSYEKNPTFTIEPNSSLEVHYMISTPSSIPAGGQYAVLFAHTLTATTSASGIRTEASPGLVVYGRSTEGETIVSAEISDAKIEEGAVDANGERSTFSGFAKVKNNGNVDFSATGTLKITGAFGETVYETPSNLGRASVIPEAELAVSDKWEEMPSFGIFHVTWTVEAGGEVEIVERTVFIVSPLVIVGTIILLTIIIVWITIMVKRRKERRSRLAV